MPSPTVDPVNNFGTFRRGAPDTRRRARADRTRTAGRYDGGPAFVPPQGLAAPDMPDNRSTTTAAVVDPMGNGLQRIAVTIDRKVDVLEDERSHRRISEGAYLEGRRLQGLLERSSSIGSSNWAGGSRVDQGERQRIAMAHLQCNAVMIVKELDAVAGWIGVPQMRILRRLLGDRMSYEQCAVFVGKSTGRSGRAFIAEIFRFALENLAESRQARGKAIPTPDDKHAAVAPQVATRQSASIAGGVTLERLEAEFAELRQVTRPDRRQRERLVELQMTVARLRFRQAQAEDGATREP